MPTGFIVFCHHPDVNMLNKIRSVTYKLIIEAGSRNHCCCHGKAISITYSECVCSLSYPACKEHALYSDLWLLRHFINDTMFGGGLLNIKHVLISFTNFV